MISVNRALVVALALVNCFCIIGADAAEPAIGVVNVDRIRTESKAARSIEDQADQLRQKYQDEIAKIEDKLRKQAALPALGSKSTASDGGFEKQYKNLQTLARSRKRQWENAVTQANAKLENKLSEIVARIAQSKGLLTVINVSATLFSQEGIDLTTEVLERLNEELPDIKIAPISD
ncbi:MAG: OmpH family outer membrane protein [Holosporales bacterium]|nr:OmpH family outer membrane protein [Holosporales bacterium]